MRTRKPRLRLIVAVAVALAAAVAAAPVAGGSPDDPPFHRGQSVALSPTAASPDDRAYNFGTSAALSQRGTSPDDRALDFSAPGGDAAAPVIAASRTGFDWGDALIGSTFGLAVALLGAGGILIALRHRRSTVNPA